MTEKLRQTIKEEVAKVPKEVGDAIDAFDWASAAEVIGKKFALSESEINDFQVITLLVLTGLIRPEEYKKFIEEEIGMGDGTAEDMAKEAGEKIFTPIMEVFERNIRSSMKNKNPNHAQNIDFILSGGNYAAFLEHRPDREGETAGAEVGTKNEDMHEVYNLVQASKLGEAKNKLVADNKEY